MTAAASPWKPDRTMGLVSNDAVAECGTRLAVASPTAKSPIYAARELFMLSRSTMWGLFALTLLGSAALAQQPTGQMEMDCSRFTHNPDGSWSVQQPLELFTNDGRVRISPGPPFKPGMSFGGLDIAKMLDRQCR